MSSLSPLLIEQACRTNHSGVNDRKTISGYAAKLDHFDAYIVSAEGGCLLDAGKGQVQRFMSHLSEAGGSSPHASRECCAWCRDRGYPDGKHGPGWSASTRKGYLAAIRFLFWHCVEEDLIAVDPSSRIKGPKVTHQRGYTPTTEEVKRLHAAPGRPTDKLLAIWMYYAPSRRQTFADARWGDIYGLDDDSVDAQWDVVGKGAKPDTWHLNSLVRQELLSYRRWQQNEARRHPAMGAALSYDATAWVFMTRNGKQTQGQALAKMLKRRAVRAGVGLISTDARHDSANGVTSQLGPHSLRRAWATHALNHPVKPLPLETIQEVLNHANISTTRLHYAHSKPQRARDALAGHYI